MWLTRSITVEQFTARVKRAVLGNNAARDIQRAVSLLLRSYGIETAGVL